MASVESLGLTGIAVPVRIASQTPAALTLSGPTMRFSAEIAQSWQHDLHKAAKRLEPWMETDQFVTRNGLGPRLAKRQTPPSSVAWTLEPSERVALSRIEGGQSL